ncbi:MAG: BamA/TamA family outer membrane protein [Vicinamibacteria bacterium]|nr:BamA/TamA family outer membrane protein [Vicinamibacteria bacterium]
MSRTPLVLVAVLAVLSPPYSAAAEDPSTPGHRGLISRRFHSFLDDNAEVGAPGFHVGPLHPGLMIPSSGAGPGPMLHLWTPDLGGSGLDFHASAAYSIYGYQYYDAQFGLVPHEGERLPRTDRGTSALFPLSDLEKSSAVSGFHIYVSARHRDYPREDFYGVGASSLKANRTDYRLKDDFFEGVIQAKISRLTFMGRAGLVKPSIHSGTDSRFPNMNLSFNEQTAPGLTATPDFLHVSAAAWLELRDQPANPHRGLSLGIAVSRFNDRHANAYQFSRVVVDAREYFPLGSHRHVIALRQVAFFDRPDAGSHVPFYLQPSFGGSSILRGYGSTRFRDDKLLALAAEYRFGLHRNLQLALIYEAGEVFPTLNDFRINQLQHSYGVGVRLKSLRRVRLRLDLLRSPERTRLDLKLGPSF